MRLDDKQDGEGKGTSHFDGDLYLIQAIYMNVRASTASRGLRDSTTSQLPKSKEYQLRETKPPI